MTNTDTVSIDEILTTNITTHLTKWEELESELTIRGLNASAAKKQRME